MEWLPGPIEGQQVLWQHNGDGVVAQVELFYSLLVAGHSSSAFGDCLFWCVLSLSDFQLFKSFVHKLL